MLDLFDRDFWNFSMGFVLVILIALTSLSFAVDLYETGELVFG